MISNSFFWSEKLYSYLKSYYVLMYLAGGVQLALGVICLARSAGNCTLCLRTSLIATQNHTLNHHSRVLRSVGDKPTGCVDCFK